ncbi:hypothetical protein EGW08_002362 [Elysia chlorotica]|uniref:ZP domain-containing protein n=1 Tax=Elysia chlorotica TaxID=188477 RepID=A0A433U7P8_ELYCH|nr:hypothetical protein EGW08_002362 [Elysia chlorotica]
MTNNIMISMCLPPWKLSILSYFVFSFEAWSISADSLDKTDGQTHKPCCLPFRFQAEVVSLDSFSVNNQRLVRVKRDWESRLQIQESLVVSEDGGLELERQVYSDFKHMVQYISAKGSCITQKVQFGMLEPCMPDSSLYLGKTFIGQYSNKADIDGWYFRRTDQNRNIEMTIAVTSDRCIPVMEHITGTMGSGQANTLVLFTNLTEDVSDDAFDLPPECFSLAPM